MKELEFCISQKKMGPISASLYLTDEDEVTVDGIFHDDEKEMDYPGPHYQIAIVPPELVKIKNEQPQRYLHTVKWRDFIRGLWKVVQDNPWFRYQ